MKGESLWRELMVFGSLKREVDGIIMGSFLGEVFLSERQVNDESLKVQLGVEMN